MKKLEKALNYLWLHSWKYRATARQHRRYVASVKGRTPIRVVFMAIDAALWKYQHVYELMARDPRFRPTIVLSPCVGREWQKDMEGLRSFFDRQGIEYVDYQGTPIDIRHELQPDIIFYTQPYEHLLIPEYDCSRFYDRLLCYMPYGFWTSTGKLSYDLHFHNLAWRLYYSSNLHLQEAQRVATNHGSNVRVVGYANADDYLKLSFASTPGEVLPTDPWKAMADGRRRKRIIWAPHFSIISSNSAFPPRANFLWMADLMLTLAEEYSDRVQIAFKPHPALLTQLYEHPQWGAERADGYYSRWQALASTQLDTGAYTSLFMTSDAMIHDSGSFAAEYHYSRRPVMFVSRDMASVLSTQSEFGRQAYAMHYLGKDEADIRRFIDDVVLDGNDPMLPQREQFFRDYLLPPGGKSVAQNVVDDICATLGL
jgi:hypothetical protein